MIFVMGTSEHPRWKPILKESKKLGGVGDNGNIACSCFFFSEFHKGFTEEFL